MAAEHALDDALTKRGLSARIISEELGDRIVGGHPEFMLVFDPIDGSPMPLAESPFFCTSLAYTEKTTSTAFEDITMAVICDMFRIIPIVQKDGKGAFLNRKG